MSGTVAPESCPPGTFSNSLGLRNIYECKNCTPGLFCNGSALTAPSGDCWPRYYCSGRAEHPAPQDGISGGNCTPGHFCAGKTPNPVPCEVCEEDMKWDIPYWSLFAPELPIFKLQTESFFLFCLKTRQNQVYLDPE